MITVRKNVPSGTIVLDRPNQCNALSREMIRELSQALSDLHQEKRVQAIILTGAGPVFCAGVDLKEWHETSMSQESLAQWHSDATELQELLEQMLRFPKPIIAAVDGAAIGLGLSLILACDLVVASQRATFSLPAPRLGLVSGLVAPLLNFRAGAATAARLMLGCEDIDAVKANQLGLVHHIVRPEQIWVRAHQWAQDLAQCAPEALMLSKRLLNEMIGESLSTFLSSGAATTATACTTEAACEGLKAFKEKRAPKFT